MSVRDPKYLHSAERRRIYPETAPRPMTGFLATLTDEQRRAVLAYDGPIALGDPNWQRTSPPLATTSRAHKRSKK